MIALIAVSGCYQSGQVLGTEDAGRALADSGRADSGPIVDGGWGHPDSAVGPSECAPFDARFDRCGGCVALVPSFSWDGVGCVEVCEPCEGADCARLYADAAACEAAHGGCGPALCASTGGEWQDVPVQCPIERCGYRDPSALGLCDPGPSCDCGPGRTFNAARGCEDDSSCSIGERCLASGGHPTNCATHATCGAMTDDCIELSGVDGATACNCGPAMRFDDARGCVPDDACGATADAVCRFSGHDMTALCAPTRCGIPSELACAAPACECGEHEIFDPHRGCVWSAECRVRQIGQSCGDDGACAAGAACCGGTCVEACYPACGAGCDGETGCSMQRPFACGELTCDGLTEHCAVTHPGPAGPSTYACEPLPSGCASCSCIPAAATCECSASAEGDLTVECFFA